jgi:hypothetical protein
VSDQRLEEIHLIPRPVEETVREPTELERRIALEKETGKPIVVKLDLEDPHPLVGRTLKSLRAARADLKGIVRPKARNCLDVSVSPENVDRAMRIMNALIEGLESRAYLVSIRGENLEITVVEVDGESIPFRLEERTARKERPRNDRMSDRLYDFLGPRVEYDYFPSGELTLHIGVSVPMMTRHSWRDGEKKRVEDWLNSFVVGLIRASQGIKLERVEAERRRVESERRRMEWEESERRRQEAERLRREEEERARQVEATLDGWIRYRSLKEMIAEVRTRAAVLGRDIPPESRLGRWLSVAERRLQKLDPIGPMLAELQIVSPPSDGRPAS